MRTDDPDWNDDGIISLYIGTFAARDDLHVVNGAAVVREPLDPDAVRKAIRHNYPLSGYMAAADGRTHVGAIDFDTDDGFDQAKAVADLLDQHGITALRCDSRRGAHLWITCADWSDVSTMHRALKAAVVLALGDEAGSDSKIEVFPKIGTGELAVGALRLPGLPHHKTQQVYPVWLGDGQEGRSTFRSIIEGHVLTVHDAVARLAGQVDDPSPYPRNLGGFYGYRGGTTYDATSASDVLSNWGVPNPRPGTTVRCPKHDDQHRSLTIFADDQRVICGAPHCVLNGQGHGVGSYNLSKMEA